MFDLLSPYALAANIRNWLYDRGFIKTCKLPVLVISVGNLSVGGSGKSSLVRYIGKLFEERLHVCILSRGYRRKTKGTLLVSERGDIKVDWEDCGDEPYMLARLLPKASLVVDEDRCRGALFALHRLKPDLIILDDAFQHRRIHRDLDILLLKKGDFSERLLPFGRLREPLNSMERADVIVLSYAELEDFQWQHTKKPTLRMVRENWRVVRYFDGKCLEDFKNLSFVAFAGLGDNKQFFQTLQRLGIKTKKKLSFPDHYPYKSFELKEEEVYITTLKDAIKLKPAKNLYYLDFDVRVDGLEEILYNALGKIKGLW
ncbi:MAG: tetraacyldisaccharide 4'-kinase [Aquificaceae bacterium]